MKPAFLLASLIGLCSCATQYQHQTCKAEIEASARKIVAKREGWTNGVYCNANKDFDGYWRANVNLIDPRHTECGCIVFLPGTSREMIFSRSGKLINYDKYP